MCDKALFNKPLHHTLLCSNNLEYGVKVRRKDYAIKHKYIQFNDHFIKFLVLDIDRKDCFWDWDYQNLPAPHFVVANPENGHCHYIYALATPICRTNNARKEPLEYFAKIQQAYTKALNADPNFAGLLTKNPNSEKWRVSQFATEPYTLAYLADFVELPKKILKREATGEGRNCYLFDSVRRFAYSEVMFYKNNGAKLDDFNRVILAKLEKLNIFENAPSLNFNELKAIAKSVSKWVWRNFTTSKFSQIQTKRIEKRWGEDSQNARHTKLRGEHMIHFPQQNRPTSIAKLAEKYGKTARTISRDLKQLGITKSREQYEQDAQERRKIAYELRESGLKWREIGEKLGISTSNAQMLAHRYKIALNASESV